MTQDRKMKVALVLPPVSLEERYGKAIAKVGGNFPPLGVLSLGAVLKRQNHEVLVLDGSVKTQDRFLNSLYSFQPDVVGISAMTFLWPKAKKLAQILKRLLPNAYLILGGVHASIYKAKCLEEAPDFDALVYGEGEHTLCELVSRTKEREFSGVRGMVYRSGDKIIENPPREILNNLDDLPFPARELIELHEYIPAISQYKVKPVTNIFTTRGCPFGCLFCTPDFLGRKVRLRSADNIIEEIVSLQRDYGIRGVEIWDDLFTVDKNRVAKFCEKLIGKKIDIAWSAQARVDTVNKELLKIMAKAGCWKLHFGIESMVQKNLDMLRKRTTVEQNIDAVRFAKEAGIKVEASVIFGIPGETYEEGLLTIRKVTSLNIDYLRFFFLTPIGPLEKEIVKYGTILTNDYSKYQYHKPVFVPFSLTESQLQRLVLLGYKRFYFNARYVYKRLREMTRPRDMAINIKGFIAISSLVIKLFRVTLGLKLKNETRLG